MHSCPQIFLPPPCNPAHPISERQDQTFPIARHMVYREEPQQIKDQFFFFNCLYLCCIA